MTHPCMPSPGTVAAICLAAGCVLRGGPVPLFVSPAGDDARDGRTPATALHTLEQARLTGRGLREQGLAEEGVDIRLLPGVYRLPAPLVLGASDCGSPAAPLRIRAEVRGAATVLGSTVLAGWQPWRDGILRATLPPGLAVREVYWCGRRLPAARFPNCDPVRPRSGGMLYLGGPVADAPRGAVRIDPALLDLGRWRQPTAGRVVIWPGANWNCDIRPITTVAVELGIVRFGDARYDLRRGNRFFVEHILEELDAPGEWYADTEAGWLYVLPPDDEDPASSLSVPMASEIVALRGTRDAPVRHVVIEGLRLAECRGTAIVLAAAHGCTVRACDIRNTGDAGLVLRDGASDNAVLGCDIAWTGSEGIRLEGERDVSRSRTDDLARNRIENNHVHHVGSGRNAGGAIDLRPYVGGNVTQDNLVRRNTLHDTPRKGVMFGGVRNVVELNHVHHTNLEQSDTGAIGLCTRDLDERGGVIRHNLIHDPGGYNMLASGEWLFPDYCWGIYLDDWTSGTTVFGNIVVGGSRGAVHIHGGQDNLVANNVFIGTAEWLVQLSAKVPATVNGKPAVMTGNRILRNLGVGPAGSAWIVGTRAWRDGIAECDRNLLWFGGDAPQCATRRGETMSWDAWQQAGFDRNSLVADPRLLPLPVAGQIPGPESPVFELGFEPIPVDQIGVYPSPDRFSWPIRQDWTREEPVRQVTLPPQP